jgi:type II secretory pathway component GspD/PulD (secretin)
MVFIRPTILRTSADAFEMSGDKYRSLRDEQRERAEVPVPLIKDTDRPVLPPLESEPPTNDTAAEE